MTFMNDTFYERLLNQRKPDSMGMIMDFFVVSSENLEFVGGTRELTWSWWRSLSISGPGSSFKLMMRQDFWRPPPTLSCLLHLFCFAEF